MEKAADGGEPANYLNLDVSEIKWKDVDGGNEGGKSMIDSIIFEF